jgi:hypothetical protein
MTKSAIPIPAAALLGLVLSLAPGGCFSWLEPSEDAGPEAIASVAASDRAALYEAAVAAFSDEDSGYRVGEMDPFEGWFQLHRLEEWKTGGEAIDVDVRLEERNGGTRDAAVDVIVVVAVATRRSLPPGGKDDARLGYSDAGRRYRDPGVERDVLSRIRESAERFRVPRVSG